MRKNGVDSKLPGAKSLDIGSLELGSGVYFLYENDELVYIGQAVNVSRRIIDHLVEGTKTFNKVRFDSIPVDSLNEVETALIKSLKPKYNRTNKDENVKRRDDNNSYCVHFRPVALLHHTRGTGEMPVRIRVYFRGRCFYFPTNLTAYPEDVKKGNIVNKEILKDLEPIMKKIKDSVKYISTDKTFEFVKKKVLNTRI